jgi:hypothetical protein
MRSVIVASAVEAFGFEDMKKTLSFVSCDLGSDFMALVYTL